MTAKLTRLTHKRAV